MTSPKFAGSKSETSLQAVGKTISSIRTKFFTRCSWAISQSETGRRKMPQPFRPNPLRKSDSYKDTHFYDGDVTELMSYMESRGGEYPYTQFFGLQGILLEEFEGVFFTQKDLDEEYENSQQHFYAGFPYKKDGWQ